MSRRKLLSAVVPEDLAHLVAQRVETGGFVSVSDYLRSLVRADLEAAG